MIDSVETIPQPMQLAALCARASHWEDGDFKDGEQSEMLRHCAIRLRELIDEVDRLKKLIDRDRTGMAAGLADVRKVLASYGWIPAGEWGCYEWDECTEENFRAEVSRCFEKADKIALDALRESGKRASEAFGQRRT